MVHYGPHEYGESEVLKLTEYLKKSARQERPVHYDDAFAAVKEFGLCSGPRDQRLWHLLGLISETEVAAGRHALSAIVVIKSGDGANRPGSGFFELERAKQVQRKRRRRGWRSWMGCSSTGPKSKTRGSSVSAAARRKIAATQRARWTKVKAGKKKAA
jgi:hypothetical protein